MPDIVSTDVTYTPQAQGQRTVFRTAPREKRVLAKVEFGDGALTYPAGGIPLTAIASDVDLQRNIRRWAIVDGSDATGIIWKVDHENAKLRGYSSTANTPTGTIASHVHQQSVTMGSTAVAAAETGALVEDSATAETVVRFPNTVIDATYDLGNTLGTAPAFTGDAVAAADFTELAGGAATPAAQTLYLYAYGW